MEGNLYKDLALIYEAMYQTFINYEGEYKFYKDILNKYDIDNVLEIGCGTGNLAARFVENNFQYMGFDLNEKMIEIAKTKTPEGRFILGDMRHFRLNDKFQSILITGRTISYLLSNKDVNACFACIHDNLEEKGVFCFDFIDANKFVPNIGKGKTVVHKATCNNVEYVRKSQWKLNLEFGMDFKWDALYFRKNKEALIKIGEDVSVVRTFSLNEIEIFLAINGFTMIDCIERETYAFPTYVIVAKK